MKDNTLKDQMYNSHPQILSAHMQLEDGRISRREFIRFATLLGMSATLAVACTSAANDDEQEDIVVENGVPKRGGMLTIAMATNQIIDHPARLSWTQGSNIVRQVCEHLTVTGTDNITRPLLLKNWSANDDVTEWTFNLRENIFFNDGTRFNADTVLFNFGEWLNPNVGSSMLGLLGYLDNDIGRVQKVDDLTVKLILSRPEIAVPENMFHYPSVIMQTGFGGDFIKESVGTGAFLLDEYLPGERVVMKARSDYWRKDENGNSLPYLDGITYAELDKDAAVSALESGRVHTLYQPRPADWLALKDLDSINVQTISTATTLTLRMRTDVAPFDDQRIINAVKMCQDREKILRLAWFGEGDLGMDAHVAPSQPAYAPRDIPKQDIEGAKALLEAWAADTGNTLPLKVTIVTKNDEGESEYAQVLKQDMDSVGFSVQLDITEAGGYWERWDEVALGITAWAHRPLSTMLIPLAYVADAEGNPVPWNETRWIDDEFISIYKEAAGTLDIEQRRDLVGKLQDIFLERGPVGISFFKKIWSLTSTTVKGLEAHPNGYFILEETYLNE